MKARGLVVAAALAFAACSRSGTLYGDVLVTTPPGKVNPAARASVTVVPSTQAFERDWSDAVAAFQRELKRAREAQQAAGTAVDEAKLAWDRALAVRPAGRRRNASHASARERELWRRVLAAERRLLTARNHVWEVTRKHDGQAIALLRTHAAQSVQTDASGHYLVTSLAVGKAYLYARITIGDRMLVWFRPFQVRGGSRRADLTEGNTGGWPFVP